ncbi:MAG: glycosyltransferase [Evtepia gabavorous]
MKIVVYAICKNERPFADRWMASMSEADEVCVLDTGSTDGTPQRLEELGAKVSVQVITPWRFDVARNQSLELVPEDADLCVCTDLDEVFQPGWREKVEAAWAPGVDRLLYRYVWNFLPDGREGMVFWYDKIHRRKGCRWVNPVHEVLQFDGGAPQARYVEGVCLEHHADRSKSRGQYLPLLELAVEEDPNNDRNVHYLGREYFFYRRWEESIAMLKRHLALPTATWADERCASMRLLAKDYFALEMAGEAERWIFRAVGEAPHLREPNWTWRTWPTTKRTGTVCFGPQAGPWPSPSGPEPTSVRRPPGGGIPGTWPAWGTFTRAVRKGAGGGPESAGPGAG